MTANIQEMIATVEEMIATAEEMIETVGETVGEMTENNIQELTTSEDPSAHQGTETSKDGQSERISQNPRNFR